MYFAVLMFTALQFLSCSGSSSSGGVSIGPNDPFSGVPVNNVVTIPQTDLQHKVEVIRDIYGIPHIYGQTMTDISFAQGYVQASDRLFEMDMFRHIGDGTLTEYLGGIPGVLDEDIHSRILGFSTVAPIVYAQSSPEIQSVLQAFCNGINTYISQLKQQVQQNPSVNPLPYEYSLIGITVTDIKPFTPLDIIAFGKYMSYSLSGEDDGTKIALTQFLQSVNSTFTTTAVSGLAHFSGFAYDVLRSEPAAKAPAVPLPNPFTKAGTTTAMNTLGMLSLLQNSTGQYSAPAPNPVSLDGALDFYHAIENGPMGKLFSSQPLGLKGSNNWTISPSLTANGYAMLANDTHLQLMNPPIFYEVQDNTEAIGNGNINVAGVVFPLAPGVIVGHNDNIAWGVTVFGPDIIDVYQFTVNPGTTPTVNYDGGTLPITTVPLSFNFGGLFNGNKVTTGTYDVYYVNVPGMGSMPLIPGSYAQGFTNNAALGLTWTGFLPSNELGAFFGIDQAQDLNQFITAQSQFKLGAQNFVYADTSGNIYFTDQCTIPVRGAGTVVSTTAVLPSGIPYADYLNPPYLILPAGSAFTWTGFLPAAAIPFTTNPSVGYVATANQDTVGVTYNNEPLDNPNYLGAFFDPGFRAQEINKDILANAKAINFNVIQNTMQADHQDTYAQRILPFLVKAYNDYTANYPTEVTTMETQAMGYLNQWTFDTPTGISETTQQVNDSIATSIYEGFAQALFQDVYLDKFTALGITDPPGIVEYNLVASLLKALEYPTETALYSPSRGQSMLFDKLIPLNGGQYTFTTRTVDQVMMESFNAGLLQLATNVFKTTDMTQWEWGKIHTLTLTNLLNSAGNLFPQINLPSNGTGYPRPGSNYTVDPGDLGANSIQMNYPTDYTYSSGPAIRFSVEMKPGDITAYNILPGGESDLGPSLTSLPQHYGDQAAMWMANQEHPEWFYPKDIIAHVESRTIFSPQ